MKRDFHQPKLHVKKECEKVIPDLIMVDLLKGVIGRGKSLKFRAKGSSMAPFIINNDVITVSPADTRRLTRGHVVAFVFKPEGKLCIHRIMDLKTNGFIIQGDNLKHSDGLILNEQVLGIVTSVERHGHTIKAGFGYEKKWIARFWHTKIIQHVMAGLKSMKRVMRKT